MTFDGLRKTPFPRTLADVLSDFADLVSKQISARSRRDDG